MAKSTDADMPHCFDMLLPEDLERPAGPRTKGVLARKKSWNTNTNLMVRFLNGSSAQQDVVKKAAKEWEANANIRFVFNNSKKAPIRVSFGGTPRGNWSLIGRDCLKQPPSKATLNLHNVRRGVALHELGHALGLYHEHQNPFGGIKFNKSVVYRELKRTQGWSKAMVDAQVLKKYSKDQIRATDFDPNSIMLYAYPASWTTDGKGTKANNVLSAFDKAFIQTVYPFAKQGAASASRGPKRATKGAKRAARAGSVVALEIGAEAVSATIPAAGKDNAYRFEVPSLGRYTIQTTGSAGVVLALFGPDSKKAYVGKRTSQMLTELPAGTYYVRVTHPDPEASDAEYAIRVT